MSTAFSSFWKKNWNRFHIVYARVVCFFVGMEPPIVRAAVSGGIRLFGSLIGRTINPGYLIFITIFSILLVHPLWVSSLSFHLSCASAAAITLIQYPKADYKKKNEQKELLSTLCGYLRDEFRISLVAYLATLPIIAISFKEISLLSPITNVAISWTTGPIAVFGMLFLMIEPVSPLGATLISYLLHPLVSFIILVAKASEQFPVPFILL